MLGSDCIIDKNVSFNHSTFFALFSSSIAAATNAGTQAEDYECEGCLKNPEW